MKGGDDPVIESLSVTANGTYTAGEGVDGYSPVTVALPLTEKTITENGIYAPTASAGYDMVNVNVPFYPREDVPLELLTSVESMEMHTEPTIGTRYYPIVYLAAIHYPAATGEEYVNVGKYFAPTDANYSVTTYIDIIDKETGESVEGFPQRTNTGANFGINSGGYIRLKGWYVTVSSNHVKVNVVTTRWNTTYSKPLDDTYATQTDLETWLSAYTTPPYVVKDDRWAVVDSGSCGDEHEEAYYTLYGNGLLEIYGTGRVLSGSWDASAVVTVDMSDTLDMHNGVFEDHTALVSAKLPNEMSAVHSETFKGCTSLASIELSENVTHINLRAFQGCTSLASITVHATTPPTLGTDVFDGCTALTAIYVPYDSMDAYKTAWSDYASIIDNIEGIAEKGSCGTDATYVLYKDGTLEISGTGAIARQAFEIRDDIINVVVGDGITEILMNAFGDCTSLTDITLADSVTEIADMVFNKCTSLENVTVFATTPPTLRNFVFRRCDALTAIYVPAASVDTYKAASNWSTYASLIQAIPSGD